MMLRILGTMLLAPKKRIAVCLFVASIVIFTLTIYKTTNLQYEREDRLREMISNQRFHIDFLESMYRIRQEELMNIQDKIAIGRLAVSNTLSEPPDHISSNMSPEFIAWLRSINGSFAAAGLNTQMLPHLRTPFVYQLLPHLMNSPFSLKPAFHMTGSRVFSDIVIGVPTVKRDRDNYLMTTLSHLIRGMTTAEAQTTLIVVMIGETDLEYVVRTARQIEIKFPVEVAKGVIEVLSPQAAYYPNFDKMRDTLGDSHKRVIWRTKHNLDTIYLMAYAQAKGTFYLMLEDDVKTQKGFIEIIKEFTTRISATSDWFFINYSTVGGIGKLFRCSDLVHFITYVQLFHSNMPIDWLLESFLADKVCTINKKSEQCMIEKNKIRPKFKVTIFEHIGLYSSLKGKVHMFKKEELQAEPTYFPHVNPPLHFAITNMRERPGHTLKAAYEGKNYFWAITPKKGDLVEFWFQKPTNIKRFRFQSSNVLHIKHKFYDTTVEVLPQSNTASGNFTTVTAFDEFGFAEGELKLGPIVAIRLRVNKDSSNWVVLSEINLTEATPAMYDES